MKLTIIDKYIAKELLTVFLSVYFVLLIIVLSTQAVHLLRWVAQGVIPVAAFLPYLSNSLFEFSVIMIPLSLLMGIVLSFGRLYSDSEMAAIMSAGIGPIQLYRPLMLVAIPASLLLFILLNFVQPQINHQRELLRAEIRSQAQIDTLSVGQFNRISKDGGVLFLDSKHKSNKDEQQQIAHVFFQQHRDNTSHVDLAAGVSSFYNEEGRRYMLMHNGVHYAGNAGDADFKIIKYKEYGIHVDIKPVAAHRSIKSKSLAELWSSTNPREQAELQWRFTLPLATIIVALMALPLSHSNPRSGRYAKLAAALIVYLLYSNLLGVGKTWIEQEKVSVWVGTWWVHIIAIAFTLVLLKYKGYLTGLRKSSINKVPAVGS